MCGKNKPPSEERPKIYHYTRGSVGLDITGRGTPPGVCSRLAWFVCRFVPVWFLSALDWLVWCYQWRETLSGLLLAIVWVFGAVLLPFDWLHRLQITW